VLKEETSNETSIDLSFLQTSLGILFFGFTRNPIAIPIMITDVESSTLLERKRGSEIPKQKKIRLS
jgi:hypothetical protein